MRPTAVHYRLTGLAPSLSGKSGRVVLQPPNYNLLQCRVFISDSDFKVLFVMEDCFAGFANKKVNDLLLMNSASTKQTSVNFTGKARQGCYHFYKHRILDFFVKYFEL